ELAHDSDDVVTIADRVTVELVRLEHALQFAHGGFAVDRLHRARHVLSGGRFEKSMHGGSSSSSISLAGQERTAARFGCEIAGNTTEHPFSEARVAIGAGNHDARADIGGGLVKLLADAGRMFGDSCAGLDPVGAPAFRQL